MTGFRIGIIII